MSQVVGEDMVTGMGFIGLEPGETYQMGPAAVEKTASGNPIVLEDSLKRPVKEMVVYGRSKQVVTTGAQLLDADALGSFSGAKIEILENGKVIKVTGKMPYSRMTVKIPIHLVVEKEVVLSCASISPSDGVRTGTSLQLMVIESSGVKHYIDIMHNVFVKTFSIPADTENILVNIYANNSNSELETERTVTYTDAMLCIGSTPLPWEPYTGGKPSPSPEYPQEINSVGDRGEIKATVTDGANKSQSVTIPTPTGLLGIPVDSGGNYTDENGQQWVCDTIECVDGRWQYMKRIGVETLNSLKMSTETTDVPGRFAAWSIFSAIFGLGKQESISNMFQWKSYGTALESRWSFATSHRNLYISPPKGSGYTPDTFNAYLAEHITADTPLIIYGQLDTPVITPLTAAQLSTYKPTTVISNDAGAEMTMTYKAKKG